MGCLLIVLALVLLVVSPILALLPLAVLVGMKLAEHRKREAELAVDYWERKRQRDQDD